MSDCPVAKKTCAFQPPFVLSLSKDARDICLHRYMPLLSCTESPLGERLRVPFDRLRTSGGE